MLAVIKLGGSVITDKTKFFKLRESTVEILSEKIAALRSSGVIIVIVHGGGSFGHPVASRYRLHEGGVAPEKVLGFAETRYWMTELNQRIIHALISRGVPAATIQTSAIAVTDNGEIHHLDLSPVERFMRMGLTPVLYGDVVPDLSKGLAILSGDAISAYLACGLKASALVFVMGAGGVYNKPPNLPGAILVRKLESENDVILGDARGVDVTGGLAKKLRYAFQAARCGARVAIGGVDHLVEMVLGLEAPYTVIAPRG